MDFPERVVLDERSAELKVDLAQFSSIRLFLEGARRIQPDYDPPVSDLISIGEACRLVEGIPLAVLLAASWITLLTPAEIATRIQKSSLNFLKSNWGDLPERQRSMRQVFEHSWNLLSDAERSVLADLSVFQGSFSFQAAQEISQCSLEDLSIFVNRTLLQRITVGRFELHFLLRQFLSEKLAENPDQQTASFNKHISYFIKLLATWEEKIKGVEQGQVIREMPLEYTNAHLAWERAVNSLEYCKLIQGVDGMGILFERLCLFREGENTFQSATVNLSLSISEIHEQRFQPNSGESWQDSVSTRLRVILRLLVWQVQFSRLLGNLQAAKNSLDRGLQILGEVEKQGINFLFEKATLLHQKGLLEYLHDRSQAQQDLFDCIELYGRIGNDWRKAQALINLSQTASALGNYEQARVFLDESLRLSRHLGDQIGIAGTLKELSSLELAEFGNLDRASELIKQRMSILQDIDNSVDIAENFSTLFVCETYRGRFEEGIKLGKEALRIYEHLGMHSSVLNFERIVVLG